MVSEELVKRLVTSLLLSALVLVCLLWGITSWTFLMVVTAMLMLLEWKALTFESRPIMYVFGVIYIGFAVACAVMLRMGEVGVHQLVFVITCVVAVDVAAYFAGKRYGKHKLAPAISPSKTWEGFGAGVLCAAIIGSALSWLEGYPFTMLQGLGTGALLACVAQAGDLLESSVKRSAGVKDSGNILPGHGGLLDRLDGHLPAFILYYLLIYGGL